MLAVRVDNSAQPNSRWYSGSGIYRHVRVVVTEPIHVAHWGVSITTAQASSETGRLAVRTRVANESAAEAAADRRDRFLDRNGKTVGSAESTVTRRRATRLEATQEITVANPALWSPESPARVPRSDAGYARTAMLSIKW